MGNEEFPMNLLFFSLRGGFKILAFSSAAPNSFHGFAEGETSEATFSFLRKRKIAKRG